ncbi:MAG: acyltransferase [Desulfobacterales bacterium]|nr:acyltransferase [Desulfobacterales bacterium]MBF0397818.1 acyltransferase [Desulfobacterales bacterium]
MNPVLKIKHIYYRLRLILNHGYYTQYLKKQGVKIGKNSVIIYPSYIDGRLPYLLEVGDNVVMSQNLTILTHDATSAFAGDLIKIGRVRILDHSFIGANTTILCNISIGPNSIVGAGSVVSKDIPPDTVYSGNPARFICTVEQFIAKHKQASEEKKIFEGKHFRHPYIPDSSKQFLKDSLSDTFGYFCAKLPENRKI